jgi:hypothetical protein
LAREGGIRNLVPNFGIEDRGDGGGIVGLASKPEALEAQLKVRSPRLTLERLARGCAGTSSLVGYCTKTSVMQSRLSHGSVPDRHRTMPNITIWKRRGAGVASWANRLLIIYAVV